MLAQERYDIRRACHREAGTGLAKALYRRRFVGRVDGRVEETDGHGLDVFVGDKPGDRADKGGRIERHPHPAIGADPLPDLDAQPTRHQRRGIACAQVVHIVAPLERDIENIGEPCGYQHGGPGALAFDQRIGHQRGAVDDAVDFGDADAGLAQQDRYPRQHRLRRIPRRGELLVDVQFSAALIECGEVRERAADVDPEAPVAFSHGCAGLPIGVSPVATGTAAPVRTGRCLATNAANTLPDVGPPRARPRSIREAIVEVNARCP